MKNIQLLTSGGKRCQVIILLFGLLLIPLPVYADWYRSLDQTPGLLPVLMAAMVISVEALSLRFIMKLGWLRALGSSFLVNVATILMGVLLSFLFDDAIGQGWTEYLALFVYFALVVVVEYAMLRFLLARGIKRAFMTALLMNIVSFVLVFLVAACMLQGHKRQAIQDRLQLMREQELKQKQQIMHQTNS
jgi:hypothetical protein